MEEIEFEQTNLNAPLVELSEQQEAAADAAEAYIADYEDGSVTKPFVLSGFAGTGKTYTIKEIIRRLNMRPAYMAYTGKAAMVLRRYAKVPATTIHSAIYTPVPPDEALLKELFKKLDECVGDRKEIEKEIAENNQLRFVLKEKEDAFKGVDLIVLDECSMVNDELLRDLQSFDLPIIALGDPGQLPPIDGTGALFVGLPNATLTEIRRQALDNPIIHWSMLARQMRALPFTDATCVQDDRASKIMRPMLSREDYDELFMTHDVVICWKNVTRMTLNRFMRAKKGYNMIDGVYPVPGERLICLKNDREKGLFNGQFLDVVKVKEYYDTSIKLEVVPESENPKAIEIEAPNACFTVYHDEEALKRMRPWEFANKQMVDFGYAITCHKSQGSQWDRVLVIDENVLNWPGKYEERAKWLYTAVTRAVEKVTIIAEGRKPR